MNAHDIVEKLKMKCQEKELRWNIHDCSICGSLVGYIFKNGNAYYDSTCDCSFMDHEPDLRSWYDVENIIDMNINNDIVKELLKLIER